MWLYCLALALILVAPAYAQEPNTAPLDPVVQAWFESTHRESDNLGCCAEKTVHCRRVEEFRDSMDRFVVLMLRDEFATTPEELAAWNRLFPGQDRALLTIPKEAIAVRANSPVGGAGLCYSVLTDTIYCFTPLDHREGLKMLHHHSSLPWDK